MNAAVAMPPRQINLYNPALLPKREHFSARQIVVGVAAAGVAMAAIAWWAAREAEVLRREVAEQARQLESVAARAQAPPLLEGQPVPTPQQVAALEQAFRDRQALLEARRAAREALKRGMAGPDAGPSALMRMVATSIPAAAWLTEVRAVGSRIEVSGKAVDPAAVEGWLARLRTSGFLAETPVPTVRVERIEAPVPAGRALPTYLFSIAAELASPLAEEGPGS